MRLLLTLALLTGMATVRAEAQAPAGVDTTWIRTTSGLEYRVVTAGRGRAVGVGGTVTIHESLTLPDVRRFGFTCVTPPESTAGVITFAKKDVGESDVPKRLDAVKVSVRVATHWLRVSPSIYNDMADVDRLLEALA